MSRRRMTLAQLEKLVPADRIRFTDGDGKQLVIKDKKKNDTNSKEKAALGLVVYAISEKYGLKMETEVRYTTERKFRADWAFPEHKIAIEYEGIMKGKSRHTNIEGYSNDCTKYNHVQLNGWKVLRYTVMNYTEAGKDLTTIFESLTSK